MKYAAVNRDSNSLYILREYQLRYWLKVSIICIVVFSTTSVFLDILSTDFTFLQNARIKFQTLHFQLRNSLNFNTIRDLSSLGSPIKFNVTFSEDWQRIQEIRDEHFFVYSAYLDTQRKDQSFARVIAVTPSYSRQQLYCYFYNDDLIPQFMVAGSIQSSKAYIDVRYSAAFIFCPIQTSNKSAPFPKYVSVLPSLDLEEDASDPMIYQISNSVKILETSDLLEPHEFGVCVQPTYNYDNFLEYVQWTEFQLLMGVTHFIFYNISIGPKVSCAMSSYGPNVKVLPWTVPIADDDLLHNNAQIAQADDCLFRSRGVSQYQLMIDLDEYIVPNISVAQNYTQLMGVMIAQENKSISDGRPAQFQFRNGFFNTDCALRKRNNSGTNLHLDDYAVDDLILFNNVRRTELSPYSRRSKFITTPKMVIEPGIHVLVDRVDDDFREVFINTEIAYLHHYRRTEHKCSGAAFEPSAQVYAPRLFGAVHSKLGSLKDKCGIEM